jgi:hypothetical protein
LTEGTVDFGASDMPMTDAQISKMKVRPLHFPTVLGGIVPTYNIPGVTQELKFTPPVLAGIFLGKIKKWSDPELKKANPEVKFPDTDILVVHRSDGSGTTFVFTDYLSKVSPEWKSAVGSNTSVRWPVGIGAEHNEGVAGLVKQSPNSIGYVELIYATQNKMGYGAVAECCRNVSEGGSEQRDGSSRGWRGQEYARRFPGIDHQRAGQEGLPHLDVHLAADPQQVRGRGEEEGAHRVSPLDAHGWPEVCRRLGLCASAQRGRS